MPEPAVAERASRARPIMAPNLFAIGFGLVGLAGAWDAAARSLGAPEAIGIVLGIVAAAFWAGQCALYLVQRWRVRGSFVDVARNPVALPFLMLQILSGEFLAARLAGVLPAEVAVACWVLALLGAGIAVAQLSLLLRGGILARHLHGGQLLPSVTGPLVAGLLAARADERDLSIGLLGVGLASAVLFTAVLIAAALLGHPVAKGLSPTLAILVSAPALGGLIVTQLDPATPVTDVFAGLTVLLVLVQQGSRLGCRSGRLRPRRGLHRQLGAA
jgi:tellurite resistance protein TehA-like permease